MKPIDRIKKIGEFSTEILEKATNIIKKYEWFMEFTNKSQENQIQEISDRDMRNNAFKEARDFGNYMHQILMDS